MPKPAPPPSREKKKAQRISDQSHRPNALPNPLPPSLDLGSEAPSNSQNDSSTTAPRPPPKQKPSACLDALPNKRCLYRESNPALSENQCPNPGNSRRPSTPENPASNPHLHTRRPAAQLISPQKQPPLPPTPGQDQQRNTSSLNDPPARRPSPLPAID